jgi:hypothetical protein
MMARLGVMTVMLDVAKEWRWGALYSTRGVGVVCHLNKLPFLDMLRRP